ncbi:g1028 [Coccomyxa viridis]|uniref:G1028 protein n=1 Tax=Coccomyxa viridis TaxID=1274662 RepID=A0ABP1FH25_9CHLO
MPWHDAPSHAPLHGLDWLGSERIAAAEAAKPHGGARRPALARPAAGAKGGLAARYASQSASQMDLESFCLYHEPCASQHA